MFGGEIIMSVGIATGCLICGEPVPINNIRDVPQICAKCKESIMTLRKHLESPVCVDESDVGFREIKAITHKNRT